MEVVEEVEWVYVMPEQCAVEEVGLKYNIGDLVEYGGFHGLILEIGEDEKAGQVFVGWFGWSSEWDNPKLLKVVNENR